MDFEPYSPASPEGSEETPLNPALGTPTSIDPASFDPAVAADDPVLEAEPWSPFGPADIADDTQPAAPFESPTAATFSDALGSNNPDAQSPQSFQPSSQPSTGQSLVPVATTPGRSDEPNRLPVRRPGEVVVTEATEMVAQQTYAENQGWAFVDLEPDRALIPDEAIALLRGDVARSLLAIPFSVTGRMVWVAVENPSDAALHDKLRRHLAGYTTRLAYADPRAIRRQIDARYSAAVEAENLARAAERNRQQNRVFDGSANTDMGRIENSAGSDVTIVLRLLIEDALLKGASDIHIEPTKNDLVTRFRIDGKLRISGRYPPTYMKPLLTKLKVDSPGMRSDNFFIPDSGMYQYKPKNGGETVDIRVEVTPTAWGSGATLRLQQNIWRPLTDIGMSDYNMARYQRALKVSAGMILATGPTGSGKALHIDTPVPTPTGWTTMGALKAGDTVLGRNGQPCTVEAAWPINESPELFRVTLDDGQTFIADRDHQWLVEQSAHSGHEAEQQAQALEVLAERFGADDAATAGTLVDLIGHTCPATDFANAASVTAALQSTDCPESAGLYPVAVALKSLALRLRQRIDSLNGRDLTRLTTAEMLAASGVVHAIPLASAFAGDATVLHVSPYSLGRLLRHSGKAIPVAYQRASIVQRLDLLRGIGLSVDTVTVRSEALAHSVLSVVRSLGWKASAQVTDKGYRVTIDRDAERLYVTSINPIDPSDPDYGPARCITVNSDDRTFLVGHGYAVTSNTTLLYASVNDRIDETRKIITLEHPIEYKVPEGVTQIMINEDQGMNFAMGLRSMLRQDPNIFLVGEIRDKITADTAIDGAATGHQVFSTLHTNDAVSAVSRLLRLGAESDALGASLRCVIGQRLVARLCINCRVGRRINADDVIEAGFDPEKLTVREVFEVNPDGCQVCKGTGVTGRVPVHEILLVSRDMRDAIAEEAPQRVLRELAEQGGMTTMRDNGWDLIQAGITSIEEVNYETLQDL